MHSISIIIPAYNEALRLPSTLNRVLEWTGSQAFTFCEVIVVDDGSRDETTSVVERFSTGQASIRLLRNPGNRGKGYAVRHGMLEAKGEWLLFTDADLSTPIEEVTTLYRRVQEEGAVIAIGSRALDPSLVEVHQAAFREWSGKLFNLVMRRVTGLNFRDTQCGFKLFQFRAAHQVFSRQKLDGFSFDVEALFIARRLSLKTVEVPVRWRNVEGTKVGAINGSQSFADLFRIRWSGAKGKYD
ncbi:MAG TPA: dolichyl-phosphate beta-glucosyltransferase [Bryobacteraceae bacterium]|nr:dolichyl-phosphate beta-glucosyltransferase [Bryobacteraceae bacterium]